jgi:hypothetical protein
LEVQISIAGTGIEKEHLVEFPTINSYQNAEKVQTMDAHMETQMVGADLKVHKVIEIEEDNTASANKEFEITQTHVVSSENQKLGTQIQVSKLSQLLEKSLKSLLQQLQPVPSHNLKHTVTIDAPRIRLNMVGNEFESIQIMSEENFQALGVSASDNLMIARHTAKEHFSGNDSNPIDTDTMIRRQPIKHFYVRKRRI